MNAVHAAPSRAAVAPARDAGRAAARRATAAKRAPTASRTGASVVEPMPWRGGPLSIQRRCACGLGTPAGDCDACNAKKKRGPLQMRGGTPRGFDDDAVDAALRSPGLPLDARTRAFFELRFERDFGDVRLHAGDDRADAAARALHAHAFTAGRDIVFGRGLYAPGERRSMRLLAHELTHVVQQRAGLAARGIGASGDASEREAEVNAARLDDRAPMTGVARGSALSRDPATPSASPSTPGACGTEQQSRISTAEARAQEWLGASIRGLDGFIRAPADAANHAVRSALDTHFHTRTAAHAGVLKGRVEAVSNDLASDRLPSECHDDTDPSCPNSGAYVPGDDSKVVFCPTFFADYASRDVRAGLLIHEMFHAVAGVQITDRAYRSNRVLPRLSTNEAFDNAESHAMFVEEVGTGRAARGTAPHDEVEDCEQSTKDKIDAAVARAQRWNRDAEVVTADPSPAMIAGNAALLTLHLGDNRDATRLAAARFYRRLDTRLDEPIDVRCDAQAAPECSATRTVYRKPARDNFGLGAGIGAAIGGGAGLIAGLATGLAVGGPLGLALGLGLGLGLPLLGTLIGLIAGAATSRPDRVHVCPAFGAIGTAPDRTQAMLAGIYETYGGLDAAQSLRHAQLARALHELHFGTVPTP